MMGVMTTNQTIDRAAVEPKSTTTLAQLTFKLTLGQDGKWRGQPLAADRFNNFTLTSDGRVQTSWPDRISGLALKSDTGGYVEDREGARRITEGVQGGYVPCSWPFWLKANPGDELTGVLYFDPTPGRFDHEE